MDINNLNPLKDFEVNKTTFILRYKNGDCPHYGADPEHVIGLLEDGYVEDMIEITPRGAFGAIAHFIHSEYDDFCEGDDTYIFTTAFIERRDNFEFYLKFCTTELLDEKKHIDDPDEALVSLTAPPQIVKFILKRAGFIFDEDHWLKLPEDPTAQAKLFKLIDKTCLLIPNFREVENALKPFLSPTDRDERSVNYS